MSTYKVLNSKYPPLPIQLAKYLTKEEISQCETPSADAIFLDAKKVFSYFKPLYNSKQDSDFLSCLKTDEDDSSECVCGVAITSRFYLVHDQEEIVVGSCCVLRFDPQLEHDIKTAVKSYKKLKSLEPHCSFCQRKNVKGDHVNCAEKKQALEQAQQQALKVEEARRHKVREYLRANYLTEYGYVFDVPFEKRKDAKDCHLVWNTSLKKWTGDDAYAMCMLGYRPLQIKTK